MICHLTVGRLLLLSPSDYSLEAKMATAQEYPRLKLGVTMEHLGRWTSWMFDNPWLSITGGIVVLGAVGRAVKWWYEIKKARRDEKAADREREISAMQDKIEELDKKLPQGLRSVPKAEEGESQEIVNRAWERFVRQRTHGEKERFNG